MLGNGKTLKLNPGDVVKVSISDPPSGLTTVVRDLTTGRTGYMAASARNGFMNTSMSNCGGHPFTFHAEYNTAHKQNMVPCLWNFGGTIPGQTVRDFGRDAQYGAPDLSFYGGTLISKVQPNPQFAGKCR